MTKDRACANDELWPDTYMSRSYLRLKAEVPNALLFLEMGAFLEAWGDDAVCAAPILNVALNRRGALRDGTPIPMCVMPADSRFVSTEDSAMSFIGSTTPYIEALLRAGHSVAIAMQRPTMPVTRKIDWMFWPNETRGTGCCPALD